MEGRQQGCEAEGMGSMSWQHGFTLWIHWKFTIGFPLSWADMALLWLWLVDLGFLSLSRSPDIMAAFQGHQHNFSYQQLLSRSAAKSQEKTKPILNRSFKHWEEENWPFTFFFLIGCSSLLMSQVRLSVLLNFLYYICVSRSVMWLFATPRTVACQAPLSMGFSRQECWSRLTFSFSRGSSRLRDWTWVSCIASRFVAIWATKQRYLIGTSWLLHRSCLPGTEYRWCVLACESLLSKDLAEDTSACYFNLNLISHICAKDDFRDCLSGSLEIDRAASTSSRNEDAAGCSLACVPGSHGMLSTSLLVLSP